ncbi:hypothetical protein AAFF_G00128250 [Aldrovandia affinis]|uniref:Uncharacterized protein n=1 Tax=Aldrovandia affinis TaxID=143900 RepID=A0AAD7T159_9TELE|nr:hypothetical protein AAFF_G00128250 [Aldrovandia affinis]
MGRACNSTWYKEGRGGALEMKSRGVAGGGNAEPIICQPQPRKERIMQLLPRQKMCRRFTCEHIVGSTAYQQRWS